MADRSLKELQSAFEENYLSIYMVWLDTLTYSFIFVQYTETLLHITGCARKQSDTVSNVAFYFLSAKNLEFMYRTSIQNLKFKCVFQLEVQDTMEAYKKGTETRLCMSWKDYWIKSSVRWD